MKRVVITACLLIFCLAVSTYSAHRTKDATGTVNSCVERALEAVYADDRERVKSEIEYLREYWDIEEDYIIHFLRHTQIDNLTLSVARLRAYAESEKYDDLVAELDSIRWQMDHINRSERMIWENLF